MKKSIYIGLVIFSLLAFGIGIFAILRPHKQEPEFITVRKAHYDSLKNELLTLKQIHEKADHIDISDTHIQDSIIREYERRHHLQK